MIAIFILSATTAQTLDNAGFASERIHIDGHFMLFLILFVFYYKATKDIVKSMLFTILFAISDEYHQRFTLGRDSSVFDICVDTLGAFISAGLLWKLQSYLPKRLRNWLNN